MRSLSALTSINGRVAHGGCRERPRSEKHVIRTGSPFRREDRREGDKRVGICTTPAQGVGEAETTRFARPTRSGRTLGLSRDRWKEYPERMWRYALSASLKTITPRSLWG